jgi:hypothetical protein
MKKISYHFLVEKTEPIFDTGYNTGYFNLKNITF